MRKFGLAAVAALPGTAMVVPAAGGLAEQRMGVAGQTRIALQGPAGGSVAELPGLCRDAGAGLACASPDRRCCISCVRASRAAA